MLSNILDFNAKTLAIKLKELNEPSYRSTQILQWIHKHKVLDFAKMLNLSKSLRAKLAENFTISLPKLVKKSVAKDETINYVFELACGNKIEAVWIPETKRKTLCISSQAGCAANCHFCSTGKGGFNKQMSMGEIVGQLLYVTLTHEVTNVVMMGMGEPLLNADNVIDSVNLFLDDNAYGLSKHRVTVSTIGIIPAMYELKARSQASLTVSLHATSDEKRTQIMPINKKYPLADLIEACKNYYQDKRQITLAYIMLKGVNDSLAEAKAVAKIANTINAKVNLIPFNSFPGAIYESTPMEEIQLFKQAIAAKGITTTIRKTRGDDVDAACGQLVGQIKQRMKRVRTL